MALHFLMSVFSKPQGVAPCLKTALGPIRTGLEAPASLFTNH